jgi:hypothetical protein
MSEAMDDAAPARRPTRATAAVPTQVEIETTTPALDNLCTSGAQTDTDDNTPAYVQSPRPFFCAPGLPARFYLGFRRFFSRIFFGEGLSDAPRRERETQSLRPRPALLCPH